MALVNACKRGCCWTPLGHSTVRDSFPAWHRERCRCHPRTDDNEETNE